MFELCVGERYFYGDIEDLSIIVRCFIVRTPSVF
jgi:hypothetical protein